MLAAPMTLQSQNGEDRRSHITLMGAPWTWHLRSYSLTRLAISESLRSDPSPPLLQAMVSLPFCDAISSRTVRGRVGSGDVSHECGMNLWQVHGSYLVPPTAAARILGCTATASMGACYEAAG